jgi:hypothetical protein
VDPVTMIGVAIGLVSPVAALWYVIWLRQSASASQRLHLRMTAADQLAKTVFTVIDHRMPDQLREELQWHLRDYDAKSR